jgi:perosamine synthetase
MKIPMAKPDIGKEEILAVNNVLKSGWLGQGKVTKLFEKDLGKYFDSQVVTVNSGSSAILCALLGMGIKPADVVAVPAFTFLSTSSVPKILGAKIIPVDIDKNTLNMDLNKLEEILEKQKIDFLIFVDVGGLPNDIDRIYKLSKKYNFKILEDAAEAIGSVYKNKKIGSFSHPTIFSFHIAKLITTIEGGCITGKNKTFIKKISAIKDIGREKPGYVHQYIGSNFRTTDVQSAIGREQLKKIEKYVEKRNNIADKYRNEINSIDFQSIPSYVSRNGYMFFFGIAKNKKQQKKILDCLINKKIDSRKAWIPVNLQPCNPELGKYKCKNAEEIYNRVFTIPIYNTIRDFEVNKIIKIINSV